MDAQSVEKHILEYAIKGMPSYKNTVDTRKTYISTLYNYLSEIIEDSKIFDETINEVMYNFVYFDRPFELTINNIYKIHINIINRLYNKYLFKKYNITEEYGIDPEKTFMHFTTNSLINFDIKFKKSIFYNNNDFYQLNLSTNTKILIPDDLKVTDMTAKEILDLSEINFHEFKRKYEQFYIKYNKLINQIESELNDLNKKCKFKLKINI